ncbi:MAG TPA: mechanosensitive ion channel family protein [Candidatus Nanoarchaeia archaeon]|nr:mechanosensitive ion channel family protein [Candidatus Nanoarchaeia archaeon]
MAVSVLSMISESLSGFFTEIIIAFLILVVGFTLGRLLGRLIERGLNEIEINFLAKQVTGLGVPIEQAIGGIVMYGTYVITILLVFDKLGIGAWAFTFIGGAVVFLLIVSTLTALKDVLPNLLAWSILSRQGIKENSRIAAQGIEGKIVHFGLVQTRVETRKGDCYIVPNRLLRGQIIQKL